MKRAVFAGSFSPVHNGHLDVINRACDIFDEVIFAVTQNKNKRSSVSIEKRKYILEQACKSLPKVKVMSFDGTLADFCKQNNVDCIIKSVRNVVDFEYEYEMATINKDILGVETLFMFSSPKYKHLSSSLVREFIQYNKDISSFVPDDIKEIIKEVYYVSKV